MCLSVKWSGYSRFCSVNLEISLQGGKERFAARINHLCSVTGSQAGINWVPTQVLLNAEIEYE